MIDYDNLPSNPTLEKIVTAVAERIGTKEKHFFRIHTAYYFNVLASMMRTTIAIPGSTVEPVNMFAVNLAPSGL